MRVAFINQPFEYLSPPYTAGSVGLWTERVMRAVPSGQAQFIVFATRYPGQPAVEQHDGIQYRRFTTRPDEWVKKIARAFDQLRRFPNPQKAYFASGLHYLGYILQIALHLRRQPVDIVHIHNFSQFVPVVRALNPRVKIVLHMHGEWLSQLDESAIRARLQKVDRIFACSQYIGGKIKARFPEFSDRLAIVYNGAEENGAAPTERPEGQTQKLLYVGRLSPEKGIHVLLQAFQQVLERCPRAELHLLGPWGEMPAENLVLLSQDDSVASLKRFYPNGGGRKPRMAYSQHLKSLVQPRFSSRITFHGALPQDQLAPFYQNADLFINASLSDAFPVPIPEAMLHGLPVIGTRVGGIPEAVVDGQTGLLVEPGSAAALAKAMLCLLENDRLREKMGRAARARCQSFFAYPVIARQLLTQYQLLL